MTKKPFNFQIILVFVITVLTLLFVYLAFFVMPDIETESHQQVKVVADTVDYQEYILQTKTIELYKEISNQQHNHYLVMLIAFLGFMIIMLYIFVSTINSILRFHLKDKNKDNGE